MRRLADLSSDPLGELRQRSQLPLALIALVCLLPFAVNHFIQGRPLLGSAMSLAVGVLGLNAWLIRLRRRPIMSFGWVLLPGAVAVVMSVATQGFYGLMWCFPAAMFFFFALPRMVANWCMGLLVASATAIAVVQLDVETTTRFVAAMTVVLVSLNVLLNQMEKLQRRLREQALRDPLTGAFNRRHMDACLNLARELYDRHGRPATLVTLDVDYFKRINDELGHDQGDDVLQALVALVQQRVRKPDLLFRAGGEEFTLLLPETSEANAIKLAEGLRTAVERAALLRDRTVTVSIGVAALRRTDGDVAISVAQWMKDADAALYAAKRQGRNQVQLFEPGMQVDTSAAPLSEAALTAPGTRAPLKAA